MGRQAAATEDGSAWSGPGTQTVLFLPVHTTRPYCKLELLVGSTLMPAEAGPTLPMPRFLWLF